MSEITNDVLLLFTPVIEFITDAVFITNNDGVIIVSNKAAQRIFTLTPDNTPLTNVTDLRKGNWPKSINNLLVKTRASVPGVAFQDIAITTEKKNENFSLSLFQILNNSNTSPVLLFIVKNTNNFSFQENQLQERLAAIVESSQDAIIGKTIDGLITSWNNGAKKMYGYEASEVLGKSISILVPPERSGELATILKKLRQGNSIDQYETIRKKKNGEYIDVSLTLSLIKDKTGMIDGVSVIARDISEKKKGEEKFRLAVEAAPSGIILTDKNGRITLVNSQIEQYFQYKSNELIGKPVEILLPQSVQNRHPDLRKSFLRKLEARPMGAGRDLFARRKDGSEFPVEIGLNPIQINGHVEVLAVVVDITGRKKAEAEINRLNANLEKRVIERTHQLEMANKELESFSYSVSHDLRAPLRAVGGFSSKLLRNYSDKLDDEGKRLIDIIVQNGKKMGQLIDDLLSFSRLGRRAIEHSFVDMELLFRETISELTKGKTKNSIKIKLEKLPPAYGDQAMLKQALVNLISNAIKFSKNKPQPLIEIGCTQSKKENIYFVKDNGSGFNMQYYDKLFGVFQRLHSEKDFEGNGIGLSLVQRIINKHNGRIWAEGEENIGATFYFSLQNQKE